MHNTRIVKNASGIDDPGRDLFRVLKRSPISQPHTLGFRRGYSDGKAVGNTTGLRRRLHPQWRISLLQSYDERLARLKQVNMSFVSVSLAVIFITRLFSTSAFGVPKFCIIS